MTLKLDHGAKNLSLNEAINMAQKSELSTLEIDVCIWRYALLAVHAGKEDCSYLWPHSDQHVAADKRKSVKGTGC